MADFLDSTLTTIQDLRHAETPGAFIKQRMAASADSLSNAARIQAAIEIANEALCKLASILYKTIDRQPVNVDAKTYRLLIPAPWAIAAIASGACVQPKPASFVLCLCGERTTTHNQHCLTTATGDGS